MAAGLAVSALGHITNHNLRNNHNLRKLLNL